MKTCTVCKLEKLRTVDNFHVNARFRDGFYPQCTICVRAADRLLYATSEDRREKVRTKSREWRRENLERARRSDRKKHLRRKYGLTEEGYLVLLQAQDGRCAICGNEQTDGRRDSLDVDHDHSTGQLRGLLCGQCNKGLGTFGDDPQKLRKAADYLERTTCAQR